MSIDKRIVDDFVANGVEFVTTVPCKQLAGVIEELDQRDGVHIRLARGARARALPGYRKGSARSSDIRGGARPPARADARLR